MIGFFFFFFFCNGNTRVFWTFIELHFSFPYFLFIIVCSSLLPFDSIYILHFLFYHFPSPPLLFHCFYRVLIFFPFLYLGCLFKLFFLLLPIFALLFFHFWAVFMPLFPTFLCIHPDKLSTPHFFIICSINYALLHIKLLYVLLLSVVRSIYPHSYVLCFSLLPSILPFHAFFPSSPSVLYFLGGTTAITFLFCHCMFLLPIIWWNSVQNDAARWLQSLSEGWMSETLRPFLHSFYPALTSHYLSVTGWRGILI